MGLCDYLRRLIAGLYAVSFGVWLAWSLFRLADLRGHYDGGVALMVLAFAGLTILPAVALLRGSLSWKRAWTFATGLVFCFWLLLLWPQHAVDRTPVFWSVWVYFGVLLVAFGWATITWRSGAGEGGESVSRLEVVEAASDWLLLRRESRLFVDVLCSHSVFSYSFLMQLDDDELAAYRAEGRAFIDRLADEIHDSAPGMKDTTSRFAPRDLTRSSLAKEVDEAAIRYRKRHPPTAT